jgi:hypothetical protein
MQKDVKKVILSETGNILQVHSEYKVLWISCSSFYFDAGWINWIW